MYILRYKHIGVIHEVSAETYEEIMEHVLNCLHHDCEVMEVIKNNEVIHEESYLMKKFDRRYY